MLSFSMGKQNDWKVNHLDAAMALFEQVYLNEIRLGYKTEVAQASAEAAAENYMAQYMSFKERGL